MSLHINFSTHGKDLTEAYQAVISDNNPTNWLVYSYDKGTNDLRVQGTGEDGLEELNDEFSDGKMQYAFARVIDPNTELPKYVFIAWCGSGVPETRKAFFNSHLGEVSRFFKSFHVQINARDEADVEPELIMKRVAESSGSKYSVHKEQARPQPAVKPVNSVYKKTEIPDIGAMQRESMRREGAPAPVGTSYQPVQTAPRPLAGRWNPQAQQDSGAAAVRAERERAEREAREREEQASRELTHRNRAAADEAARREREDNERQRQQQQEADARRREEQLRRQQEEAEQRRRADEEAERRRQQEFEARQQEAEHRAEEDRRQQQEQEAAARQREEQQQLHRAQEEERQRKAAEEARRLERERKEAEDAAAAATAAAAREQQEQLERESALHDQLDQTAERAVHAASSAAGTAVGQPNNGTSAVVLFGYVASEENEMTLNEGEVINQIDQVDEGWWFGISEDGKKQGLFPANYVQLLEEEEEEVKAQVPEPVVPAAAPAAIPAPAPAQVIPAAAPKQDMGITAIALYDYDAGEDNEITFKEGHRITHIEFVSEDWWQGVAADGKTVGLFPANYVELQNQ